MLAQSGIACRRNRNMGLGMRAVWMMIAAWMLAVPATAPADEIEDLAVARAAYLEAWRAAPLHAVNATFVTREAAHFGDAAPRGSTLFAEDEAILIYLELRGYDFRPVRGGVEFGVAIDLELTNDDGRTIFERKNFQVSQLQAQEEVFSLFSSVRLKLGGLTGPHTAKLIIRDIVSDQQTEVPLLFEIDG